VKETIWYKALKQSSKAIESGALIPLDTFNIDLQLYNQKDFEIRKLKFKFPIKKKEFGPLINPFLPWDKRLKIIDVLDSHLLILNKYPVQLGHMLLITNTWAPQNGWLKLKDFEAMTKVEEDTTGLWFFNSSPLAGASQPHRHLQLLRREKTCPVCPRDNWFIDRASSKIKYTDILGRSIGVSLRSPATNMKALELFNLYKSICFELCIGNESIDNKPLAPYNMIITSKWISVIRRERDFSNGFNINSLGFAGYLITDNDGSIDWIKRNGALKLLESVVDPC